MMWGRRKTRKRRKKRKEEFLASGGGKDEGIKRRVFPDCRFPIGRFPRLLRFSSPLCCNRAYGGEGEDKKEGGEE
jgi:hypothetical protein